jgi:hypothetical protein
MVSGEVAVATKSDSCDSKVLSALLKHTTFIKCSQIRLGQYHYPYQGYLGFQLERNASIAQSLSNTAYQVSAAQLATWSRSFSRARDHIAIDQLICGG